METDLRNLYSVLGVEPSATKAAIKAAFRSLAKKYHPDMNKGNKSFEKKFKAIKQAYEILSDDQKRYEYDKTNGYNQIPKETKTYSNPYKAQEEYKKQTSSYTKKASQTTSKEENNFKEEFSKFVNDVFYSKEKTSQAINGTDINLDLTVSIFEAQTGTTRRVNILHSERCPNCHGKKFINSAKCPKCSGTGEITTHKTIMVKIPAGTVQGNIITIQNEGNRGEFGGKNGNLNLKINVEKNDLFRFDGLNVLSDLPITPSEAALGTSVQINTIDGLISMKIPPETSSGQKFRLHGQGIFDKENNKKGDHIVTVSVKIPKNLSPQEKELYNKLARLRNFNPREK